MADAYKETLQDLSRQMSRKQHLEAALASLKEQRSALADKVRTLDGQRGKEQGDVDRLEGHSLAAFFYGVIGKMDDKLDQERQEAYAAAVRYEVARRELDSVEEELQRGAAELKELRGCEARYQELLEKKAAAIKASGLPEGGTLLELERRIALAEDQIREIREAIAAGEQARDIAVGILSSLDSAEGWGTWDLLGGGLLTDLAKHGHLDDAQRQVERLQIALRRFQTELADVTIYADMQVQIEGFLRFADYFFDGLFADWAVLDRIHSSQEQVRHTAGQIDGVLRRLDAMLAEAEQERSEDRGRLDALVLETAL